MINKEFTSREKGMIKNVAKAVYPMFEKKLKLVEKAEALKNEIEELEHTITKWEQGVMDLTGGHTSIELVEKKIVTCGEGDKAIRKAVYNFYYGDNIIPPDETFDAREDQMNAITDMTSNNSNPSDSNNQ